MSEIAELRGEMRDLRRELKTVNSSLSTVQSAVSALDATLRESKGRHESEIGALFDKANRVDRRVSHVERDYVPKDDLEKVQRQNDAEHKSMNASIDALKISMAKVLTLVTIASAVISAVIQGLFMFFRKG